MNLLLLDNRDSFVWNLAQAFGQLGATVEVRRSDATETSAIVDLAPDALVLSPGPGRPEQAGCCVDAVRRLHGQLPILGVCLGHQAIAAAFGAIIERSPPCHGKAWDIHHDGSGLFAGLPATIRACRYHSLTVAEGSLPADWIADARTAEGVMMSLRHLEAPTFGLQFHPESFRSPDGLHLLGRFLEQVG